MQKTMSEDFLNMLGEVQAMQRRFSSRLNSFSVTVKYDDYYEYYMEIEIRTDEDKFFFSTYSCVSEDDYELRIGELSNTINELLNIEIEEYYE